MGIPITMCVYKRSTVICCTLQGNTGPGDLNGSRLRKIFQKFDFRKYRRFCRKCSNSNSGNNGKQVKTVSVQSIETEQGGIASNVSELCDEVLLATSC